MINKYILANITIDFMKANETIRPIQRPHEPNFLPETQYHYKLAYADHTIHRFHAPRRMRSALG